MAKDLKIEFKWYGTRVTLSHKLVRKLLKNSDITDVLMSAGGLAAAAASSPIAPVIAALAVYVKLEMILIKRLDKGKGVYLVRPSGTGIFIPRTVK